ncbi:MAG: GntR family transcriptional regulator [Solobacterium sp.]|nr:GntR family transcriptional regulator [Solobacterium sp.]
MHMIIQTSSMIPIYEQIMEQIKKDIASGALKPGDSLPSVRQLAADLKISALTVKKAYDRLEAEGFTSTVHGKGTYVTGTNLEMIREEQRRVVEHDMEAVVQKALACGMTKQEIRDILDLLTED